MRMGVSPMILNESIVGRIMGLTPHARLLTASGRLGRGAFHNRRPREIRFALHYYGRVSVTLFALPRFV